MEEQKIPQPKTILDLVKMIYNDWDYKSNRDFIVDVNTQPAEAFALSLHHSLGRHLRNEFGLWTKDTPLYEECKSLGLEHADDMSHRIILELHKYTIEQSNKKS